MVRTLNPFPAPRYTQYLWPAYLQTDTPGSKAVAATAPIPPMPMPMPMFMPIPSVSPPPSAHARVSPVVATSNPMIQSSRQSPSPLWDHPSNPATLEPQKHVSSPRAPATPRLSPGTNPSSKPVGIINSNRPTQIHPQPAPKYVKPAPKQIRNTKVDKPVQDARGARSLRNRLSPFQQSHTCSN